MSNDAIMTQFDISQFTTDLPVLSQQFQPIQDRIQTRQQIVREGRRPRRELFGLMRGWEPIGVDERYRELQILIRDYRQVIQTLHEHQQSYQSFFVRLKTYVNSAVSEACQRILKAEEKRLILQQRIQGKDNPALLATMQTQQDQLAQSVQMLGQAAFLLLRKIDLFTESLDRLARDKQLQSEVLDRLVEDLQVYQEVYQLQKEIDQIQKDVAEMADVALNFEELMREHLGPFQSLIDQVVQVDKDLFHSVEEIEEVTRKLLSNQFGSLGRMPQADNLLLDFLIRANVEKDWLISTLNQVRVGSISETLDVEQLRSVSSRSDQISIQKQVENIQTFVHLQLDIHTVDLPIQTLTSSATGIDYSKLDQLLRDQKWKEADQLTAKLMLQAADQTQRGYLNREDIERFPGEDLKLIDKLWVDHSNGTLGLSVQKRIWKECGSPGPDYSANKSAWIQFGRRVNWQGGTGYQGWRRYSEIDMTNPQKYSGHLPMWGWVVLGGLWSWFGCVGWRLFSREEI